MKGASDLQGVATHRLRTTDTEPVFIGSVPPLHLRFFLHRPSMLCCLLLRLEQGIFPSPPPPQSYLLLASFSCCCNILYSYPRPDLNPNSRELPLDFLAEAKHEHVFELPAFLIGKSLAYCFLTEAAVSLDKNGSCPVLPLALFSAPWLVRQLHAKSWPCFLLRVVSHTSNPVLIHNSYLESQS